VIPVETGFNLIAAAEALTAFDLTGSHPGVSTIIEVGSVYSSWLDQGGDAVLIRPDFYTFGSAMPDHLDDLVEEFGGALLAQSARADADRDPAELTK